MASPLRGEIWLADLEPVRGHEQGGKRPCLVVSATPFNESPLGLVVVLPITSKQKGFASHVKIDPGDSGLKLTSFVKCEDIRSISRERLSRVVGKLSYPRLQEVVDKLQIILEM